MKKIKDGFGALARQIVDLATASPLIYEALRMMKQTPDLKA